MRKSWQRVRAGLLLIIVVIKLGLSIRCYECVHNKQKMKRRQRFVFPCSEFDGSADYVVTCPDSHFCVYQSIFLSLATKVISVHTMDGCTPNVSDTNRLTEASLPIEGCTSVSDSLSPSSVLYCFCPRDFCNGIGGIRRNAFSTLCLALIVVFFVQNAITCL